MKRYKDGQRVRALCTETYQGDWVYITGDIGIITYPEDNETDDDSYTFVIWPRHLDRGLRYWSTHHWDMKVVEDHALTACLSEGSVL